MSPRSDTARRRQYERNRRAALAPINVRGDRNASHRFPGHAARMAELARRAAAALPLFDGDERDGDYQELMR